MVASNGAEALETVEKQMPDMALLDIMMPNVDGYEICKHIKKLAKLNHIKVVSMITKIKEADVQKGYLLGASLYITKPFTTREPVKQVKELKVYCEAKKYR